MRQKIKKYFEFIGLSSSRPNDVPNKEDYKNSDDINLSKNYLDYLKELDHYQNERQQVIENKNAQIVGQASIVVTILGLFIPLLLEEFIELGMIWKILTAITFLFIFGHYFLSIYHSTRTLLIDRYTYSTGSTKTITKKNRATLELTFINEQIKDLIYIVDNNSKQNSKKGENLILATRTFRIANIGFAFFIIFILIYSFTIQTAPQKVFVISPQEVAISSNDTLNMKQIDKSHLEQKAMIDSLRKLIITKESKLGEVKNMLDSLNNQ